jgi:hypothetical protein
VDFFWVSKEMRNAHPAEVVRDQMKAVPNVGSWSKTGSGSLSEASARHNVSRKKQKPYFVSIEFS